MPSWVMAVWTTAHVEAVKKEIVMTVKRDNPEEKLKDFWSQATSQLIDVVKHHRNIRGLRKVRASVRVRVRVRVRAICLTVSLTRTPNPSPSPSPKQRKGGAALFGWIAFNLARTHTLWRWDSINPNPNQT